MASNYAGGQYKEYTAMLRQRMSELPSFCAEFFRGIENETLVRCLLYTSPSPRDRG